MARLLGTNNTPQSIQSVRLSTYLLVAVYTYLCMCIYMYIYLAIYHKGQHWQSKGNRGSVHHLRTCPMYICTVFTPRYSGLYDMLYRYRV